MNIFFHFGKYFMLIRQVFTKPDKGAIFRSQLMKEIDVLGIDSLGIVFIVSIFMGAIITIQSSTNLENPLVPAYLIGYTARESLFLEFCPTIISLLLAGKVGSRIASEIGTMRVTEQIDALEIMGVNSANYLILPKIVACVIVNPFLIIISMFVGLVGGWVVTVVTGVISPVDFIYGVQFDFKQYIIFYIMTKTLVFAFLITSVSAFHGYFVEGGSLEVGRASTRGVVYSSLLIILSNLILTKLILL